MTSQVITLETIPVVHMELTVPNQGAWICDCKLGGMVALTGKVTIRWGDTLKLVGTIDPDFSTGFAGQSNYRIIGGARGWGKTVARKGYHADNGVSTRRVATEIADEVGETIDSFEPGVATFGTDYSRRADHASRILEGCAKGNPWWVDFAGRTHVGPRPTSKPDPEQYRVLDIDADNNELLLGLETAPYDAPGSIVIGSTIVDDRLDKPYTVRELFIVSVGASLTCRAWCSDVDALESKLDRTFGNLVRSYEDRIWGKWRYRVLDVVSDGRVNLQSLRRDAPVPDAILVSQSPGFGGVHVKYVPGAIVHVEFLEGDPALPRITGAENWVDGKRDDNSYPTAIELGGPGTQSPVAIAGSLVQSGGIGTTVTFCDATGVPVYLCYAGSPPVPCFTPVQVSFGLTPANPLSLQPLYGAVMTGSKTTNAGPP